MVDKTIRGSGRDTTRTVPEGVRGEGDGLPGDLSSHESSGSLNGHRQLGVPEACGQGDEVPDQVPDHGMWPS